MQEKGETGAMREISGDQMIEGGAKDDYSRRQKIRGLFATAKNTVGLSPIDKHDIERFMKPEHGGTK